MSDPSLDLTCPIPLFPLPNCVLFPGVVQPLHIFEPRYKEMIADSLDEQAALAIALLQPGWEQHYYSNPAIHPMVCVGKIIAHELLDDGKYNLLLHGVARARILSEKKHSLYRTATLEPILEPPAADTPNLLLQRRVLHDLFEKTALKDLTVAQSLVSLFDDAVPTPRLIDVLAFTLVQDVPAKQQMLEELDPLKRGEYLLRHLVTLTQLLDSQPKSATPAEWPPPISAN